MGAGTNTFLEVADAIGCRLCRDALRAGDRCNWVGPAMEFIENRWQVVYRTFGPDFYSGTSGIAFFLARLSHQTGNKFQKQLAEAALRQALSRIETLSKETDFGFYSGLTGIAYALLETCEILDRPEFATRALDILRSAQPSSKQTFDVVSGSAGVIPALLKLHERWQQDFLLDAAMRHGHLLLQNAHRGGDGWSWDTMGTPGQKHLTGFSHGTAGIAWALIELYSNTHDREFLVAGTAALDYERHLYNPQQGNWPDFRTFGGVNGNSGQGFTLAWCHGAPGIGLCRLRVYQVLGEAAFLEEAKAAINTTSTALKQSLHSQQGNLCLCHGNAGNAELLIEANEILHDNATSELVNEIAESGVQRYAKDRNAWPCGVLSAGETPNLMLGLAGIGYFYLRLANPKKVPSVLIVKPALTKAALAESA